MFQETLDRGGYATVDYKNNFLIGYKLRYKPD
jgi:hypothetical protein